MIYGFTANHSDIRGSRFQATVIHNGINYGELIGFVLYPINEIVIHDPINRKRHRIPIDDYNKYQGDMIDFVIHVIKQEIKRRDTR